MQDPKPLRFPVVAWSPFFDRGKFMYWVQVGRGVTTIDKTGRPRTKFHNSSHVSGGSIWTHLLPEGETPESLPDNAQEHPNRPTQTRENASPADEEGDFDE
jgi:hypothetical protein